MELYAFLKILQKKSYFLIIKSQTLNFLRIKKGNIVIAEIFSYLNEKFPSLIKEDLFSELKVSINELKSIKTRWNIKFCCYGEDCYPLDFYNFDFSPLCFTYIGSEAWQKNQLIGVVGSREPTEKSVIWLEHELSIFLDHMRIGIVSGGARGVDQLAHKISMRKKVPTLIILPSGLANMYPESIHSYIDKTIDVNGSIISEYDLMQPMRKHHFLDRNRIISSLSKILLIIEARMNSGTMITANHAANFGKPVLVVPSHPLDRKFSGSLSLVCDGATMVRNAEDLISICRSEINLSTEKVPSVVYNVKNNPCI